MARTSRCRSNSDIYHVVIRGAGKQILFETREDGKRFLWMMKQFSGDKTVLIYGYCLMENHVHLLLKGEIEKVSMFMKRLEGTYALYFNEKYERSGTLFHGRYFSEPVNDERQFLATLKYIIMNPERAGVCARGEYEWSCYKEYQYDPWICDISFACTIAKDIRALRFFLDAVDASVEVNKRAVRLTDEEAKERLKKMFSVTSGTALQSFDRSKRNQAIIQMRKEGLSVRQIERLTGISRGIIQEIKS